MKEKRSKEALERRRQRHLEKQRDGRYNHSKKAWRERNPEKLWAANQVNNAVRDGKLEKPESCPQCGRETRIIGHHDDYTKPLDVEWMCGKCHYAKHNL